MPRKILPQKILVQRQSQLNFGAQLFGPFPRYRESLLPCLIFSAIMKIKKFDSLPTDSRVEVKLRNCLFTNDCF